MKVLAWRWGRRHVEVLAWQWGRRLRHEVGMWAVGALFGQACPRLSILKVSGWRVGGCLHSRRLGCAFGLGHSLVLLA